MAKITADTIDISLPFAVPYLGSQQPTTLSIDKATLQLVVRIIVGICSVLLFWPRIRAAFGLASKPTEDQTKEIQDRIAKIEHERDQKSKGQKSYAVATGTEGKDPTTPATGQKSKEKGSAKRRKA